jgi:hypothetical protein
LLINWNIFYRDFLPFNYVILLINWNIFYRDFLALNVYVALCYYKLDYYDVSQVRFEVEVKSSGLKSSNFSLELSILKSII